MEGDSLHDPVLTGENFSQLEIILHLEQTCIEGDWSGNSNNRYVLPTNTWFIMATCFVQSWLTCPQRCRRSIRVVGNSAGGCRETDPKRMAQGFQTGGEGFQQWCSLTEADPSAGAQTSPALEIKI